MDLSQRQLDILTAMPLDRAVVQVEILPAVNAAIEWRWIEAGRLGKPQTLRLHRARNLAPSMPALERLGLIEIDRSVTPHTYQRIQMSLEDMKCG